MIKKYIMGILVLLIVLSSCADTEKAVDTNEGTNSEKQEGNSVKNEVEESKQEVDRENEGQEERSEVEDDREQEENEAQEDSVINDGNSENNHGEATLEDEAIEQEDHQIVTDSEEEIKPELIAVDEVKAVWLAYLDLLSMFESGTQEGYTVAIENAMRNIKDLGMNTVMFQVRPFGDALYPSKYYPISYVVTGEEGADIDYDPFEIAIESAHKYGLRIEAWINPFRIRTATSTIALSSDNIASEWYMDDSRRVLKTKEGILMYNPANEEVRELIVNGVKELIEGYNIEGIHFDDYFYPTTDMTFDENEYFSFVYRDDSLSQADWRRENVNILVKEVYNAVHDYDDDLVFGISPQGDIEANYEKMFIDIPLWLSEDGYIDYISPQMYFGFEHSKIPYESTMDRWDQMIKVDIDLIVGLSAYKVGTIDEWAGEGSMEWVESENILASMIEVAMLDEHYTGYALFRYDYLFNPSMELEERMEKEKEGIGNIK